MGIFSSIRNAIFGRRQQAQPAATGAAGLGAAVGQAAAAEAQQPPAQPQQQVWESVGQAEPVDVEQVLQEISQEKGNPNLNYKTSIVDLMKLLDLDSSLDNRKELARELAYTGELNGSAEMNIWLHRKVMEELERNGGKVSQALKS